MAKLERTLSGVSFDHLLHSLDRGILEGSLSASYEDGSDFFEGDMRCTVRIYERYSAIGSNRVSLTLTLFGTPGTVHLSAITAGGSEAMFFKMNTFGEGAFLDRFESLLDRYVQQNCR